MPDGSFYPSEVSPPAASAFGGERGNNSIRIEIAETLDDLVRCRVVRALVWLNTPGAKYNTQFDRNDLLSTHLLVWVGDEPAGTMRVRCLPDSARFEKLSVRPEFRSYKLFRDLAKFAMRYCASKGYSAASSLAIDDTVKLWQRFGARVVGEPLPFTAGHDMVPMLYDLNEGTHPALEGGVSRAGQAEYEMALFIPEADLVHAVAGAL